MTEREIKKTSKELMQKLERLCNHVNTRTNGDSELYLQRSILYEAGRCFEVVSISTYIGGKMVFCESLFLSNFTTEEDVTAFYEKITNKIK